MNADRVSLTFVCIDCGSTLVVGLPGERGVPPGRYPWRCFNCQESWPGQRIGGIDRRGETTKQEKE